MSTKRLQYVLSFVVIFLLTLSPIQKSVQAQGPLPPTPPVQPTQYPPVQPLGVSDLEDFLSNQASMGAQGDVQAAAVSMGEPGLSYRPVKTFGTTGEPYLADGSHLYTPNGLFIDSSNNLYVVEENGDRMLKFNASGVNTLTIGHAGYPWHQDDFLSYPKDVAVDSAGNIWVVISPAIKEFDSAGNLIQIFPETNPWEGGSANDRFNDPRGIAFDSTGKMYISDSYNHRIQVYDVSGGAPTYVETIGETGVSHNDNAGFNQPAQIAFDSLGRLYVVDIANYRVQRCTKTTGWTCETFFGVTGEPGNDLNHMGWSYGITIRNDNIYIAEGDNYRVLKCDTSGTCSHFAGVTGTVGSANNQFAWPADVAVDSTGNVYVSDFNNHRIQKFNSSGTYLKTIGVTRVPYLTNANHINTPWGVAVNAAGDVFVTENRGYRLLKYNTAGSQIWTVGTPGIFGNDNIHFGQVWGGSEGNPAVDASGRIYVPDTNNNRVQIFNSTGSYYATLGTGLWGSNFNDFASPNGVAINPINGDIYVADMANHRIQVFTASRVYKATLGQTGVEGNDNAHFRWPRGVAVASNGDIFVADSDNHRVQKCNFTSGLNYTCTTFAGETGIAPDGTYAHIHPLSVAVDSSERVFVADEWDGRVMVYDSAGAFLTSIGDNNLSGPSGVAVDSVGNVYIADRDNHRIQKFSPGVPGWQQVNVNGFGDRYNRGVTSLEEFGGMLYAGASNWEVGGTIWRSADTHTWTQVSEPGFGNTYGSANPAIIDMFGFNGQLYAGVGWDTSTGQLWRSTDGTTWEQVVGDGFGDPDVGAIQTITAYNNMLYVGTGNTNTGGQIWRSSSGNNSDWTKVVNNGFGCGACNGIVDLIVFNDSLYAAVAGKNTEPPVGMQIWRTNNGSDWSQVGTTGFGSAENYGVGGFTIFNGSLYIGTQNAVTGGQIWRSSDGSTWAQAVGNGFGDTNNIAFETLYTFGGNLYVGAINSVTGFDLRSSSDGKTWSQINLDGFGDSNNDASLWSHAIIGFNDSLYVGTWNWNGNGGEIWKYVRPVVMTVNTILNTGDSVLSEDEQVVVPVSQFTVTFNKDINPPTTASFSLKNGTTIVPVNSVLYDAGTRTATVKVNGGVKLPAGSYTFTVKGSVTATDGNTMAYDFVRHFAVPAPLTVPTLLSPANNSLTTDYTPRLDWSATVPAPGVSFDHYRLRVASDPGFNTILLDQDIAGLMNSEYTFPSDLNPNTTIYWYVQAYSATGQVSGWSPIWSFHLALLPVTLNPLQNGNSLRPTFSWVDPNITAPLATGYSIQISAAGNFSTLLTSGSPSTNSYTPTVNLPAGKTVYWRVRANGINGPSPWMTSSFATPIPPSTATLLLPANNSLNTNYTPLFKWSVVTLPLGTTFQYYQFQVDDNNDFSSPVIDDASITNRLTTQFQVVAPLAHNTKYYWRVLAFNNLGHYSASAVWTVRTALTPPTLVSPDNGFESLTPRPTFEWDDIVETGLTGYTIQISASNTFATIIHTSSPAASTYTPTVDLLKNKTLYWRVQAKGTNGPSAWSEVRSFTSANAPTTPVLSLPIVNSLSTNYTPLFKWNAVTMPLGTSFQNYHLQVDDNQDFSSPEIDNTLLTDRLATQFQVVTSLAHNTKFYWRVQAVNTDGEFSNWSTVWYFRAAVDTTTLLTPANGITIDTLKPVFDWDDVSETGVSGYTIQVATSSAFGTLLVNSTTVESNYARLTNLPAGKMLYWRVRVNGANGPSVWSDVFSFNTSAYHEAPSLAAKVAAGTLPTVDKRLPDTPVITIANYAVVGKYGGILQTASWWPEVGNVQLYFAAEAPIKWNAQLTGYEPGLAESYDWSADGRTFTLHLRKGLKWSDGVPYTSADWKYWWEDYALNPHQHSWTIPAYLRNADGTPITMTFPDDYTVVWTSKDRSLYIDPYFMAQGYWEFAKNIMKPAHYLKQFNPKYYPTKTWENYATIDQWWINPKYPCLFAWCLSSVSGDGLNYTFSRNPYYWRVDADGNQLPYIDQIRVEIVSDEMTRINNCAQGKYDTAFRICGTTNEIPFLTAHAATGGYHLLANYMNGAGAWPGYMVNQDYVEGGNNYADDTPEHAAEIRSLLRNHNFRVALSTGFDRQAVINAAWGGVGEPQNATISPQSFHFTDPAGQAIFQQWAGSYTTFNAFAANALLDGLGMTKDVDGWRQLPSGKPFIMTLDISDWGGSLQVQVDAANEMKKQWETNLGIQIQINNLQGDPNIDTRTNEGYYMMRAAHISELDVLTYPDWMFPVVNRYMFPLEGRWFEMGGNACTEPSSAGYYPCGLKPEDGSPAQILQGLYNDARETSTFEGRNTVVQAAVQELINDGPFVIGVSGDRAMPILVKNYMKNILDYGVVGPWAPATPGNQLPALWWMDK